MSQSQTKPRSRLEPVEARGNPYQVGLALGRAAGRAMREVVPRIGRFRALKNDYEALRALDGLERAARDAFPDVMREVDGIVAGSGAEFRDLWLWNCRGDIAGGGDHSRNALAGCTTVLIPGADGRAAVIGHNEDDQPELDGSCFLARVVPDDGPAFLSFYSPGLLPGHTFAVNDAGLVQTINHIRPYDQRPGIPRHVIARAVLSQSSLESVFALLKRDDRASGFHHNLGFRGDPTLYSVEAPASRCVIKEVTRLPQVHTNHLLCEQFAGLDQELTQSSSDRLRRARAIIDEGALAQGDPLTILQDAGGDGMPIFRKGHYPEDPGYTLASAIFKIGTANIDWRVYTDSVSRSEHAGRISVR